LESGLLTALCAMINNSTTSPSMNPQQLLDELSYQSEIITLAINPKQPTTSSSSSIPRVIALLKRAQHDQRFADLAVQCAMQLHVRTLVEQAPDWVIDTLAEHTIRLVKQMNVRDESVSTFAWIPPLELAVFTARAVRCAGDSSLGKKLDVWVNVAIECLEDAEDLEACKELGKWRFFIGEYVLACQVLEKLTGSRGLLDAAKAAIRFRDVGDLVSLIRDIVGVEGDGIADVLIHDCLTSRRIGAVMCRNLGEMCSEESDEKCDFEILSIVYDLVQSGGSCSIPLMMNVNEILLSGLRIRDKLAKFLNYCEMVLNCIKSLEEKSIISRKDFESCFVNCIKFCILPNLNSGSEFKWFTEHIGSLAFLSSLRVELAGLSEIYNSSISKVETPHLRNSIEFDSFEKFLIEQISQIPTNREISDLEFNALEENILNDARFSNQISPTHVKMLKIYRIANQSRQNYQKFSSVLKDPFSNSCISCIFECSIEKAFTEHSSVVKRLFRSSYLIYDFFVVFFAIVFQSKVDYENFREPYFGSSSMDVDTNSEFGLENFNISFEDAKRFFQCFQTLGQRSTRNSDWRWSLGLGELFFTFELQKEAAKLFIRSSELELLSERKSEFKTGGLIKSTIFSSEKWIKLLCISLTAVKMQSYAIVLTQFIPSESRFNFSSMIISSLFSEKNQLEQFNGFICFLWDIVLIEMISKANGSKNLESQIKEKILKSLIRNIEHPSQALSVDAINREKHIESLKTHFINELFTAVNRLK
jgi:hypothetical protein